MELPKRKNIRLKNYDYSQNNAYFITICVKDRHELLWKNVPVGAIMNRPSLSEQGIIVENAINDIPNHYSMLDVETHVIMPNHLHMILTISDVSENGRFIIAPTISRVVQPMKRIVSKQIGYSIW